MRIVSKALKLITIGAAVAALVLVAFEISTTRNQFLNYDNMAWFRLPGAGALGLAAGAMYVGTRLRRGRADYARWLGAGLIVIGLAVVALIVGLLGMLAALVYAWGSGP
jgi:hypothetical protein